MVQLAQIPSTAQLLYTLLLTHHKPGCEQIIEKQCRDALAGWQYQHLQRGDLITP